MVARAINFDVENYNRAYNAPDRALKKRYSKNFIRFVDNPLAYTFWHARPYMESGAFKFLPFFWFCTISLTKECLADISNGKHQLNSSHIIRTYLYTYMST